MVTVVLVEDNAVVREEITAHLESDGFTVVALNSWNAVEIRLWSWRAADILVCDGDLWDGKTAADVFKLFRVPNPRRVLYSSDIGRFQEEFPERILKGNINQLISTINALAET